MYTLREAEEIEERKEFCDCRFVWVCGSAEGESTGETLPAISAGTDGRLPRRGTDAENAAAIPAGRCWALTGCALNASGR